MSGETLVDVLLDAVERTPEQVLVQVDSAGAETARTYRQLCDEALRIAGGLRAEGLLEGMPVLILPTGGTDFVPAFWGAVLAGAVPVPVPPQLDRVRAVQEHFGGVRIVVAESQTTLARTLVSGNNPRKARMLTLEQLRHADPMRPHRPQPEDLALLQFSSGSTNRPKGVQLTHGNLVANLRQARLAGAASASDVVVSWLPYFHDMGLIGAHLTALSTGAKQVSMEPAVFAKRPALWLQVADRHRATVLPIASFALALTCQRVSAEQVVALDLSCVRMVGVGAEPIPVQAWREFAQHLRPAGLDPRAMTPLYGLAEATVAVAFGPVGQLARTLRLDRCALADGRAVNAEPDSPPVATVELMEIGPAVMQGELRVVDGDGVKLGESRVGHVEFRGPNVAQGYDGLPAQTSATFVDGWLRTGDLGFLRQGRLCVTGRAKDVLYVNGQKHHAHDVEQVVAATPGVPSGPVAVVGSTTEQGTERVTVFVTAPRPAAPAGVVDVDIMTEVRSRVREALGHDDVSVVPIPARRFPRTTSGKIQRAELRAGVVAGEFDSLTAVPAPTPTLTPPAAPTPAATPSPTPGHAHRSRTEVEAIVTAIWARVLDVPATQIQSDDRFLAIGGTSLSAMQLLAHLEDEFGGPLEPAVLRDCGTVAALADHLIARPRVGPAPAQPVRPTSTTQPAAVIGMACRFPDADTPEAFWDNLVQGKDSVTRVPAARWSVPEEARARWGAFLDDVAGFDADWFGMGDDEAAMTDPHARIFLEVAHEALERAGYAGPRRRGRRIGVFVAVGESGYAELLHQAMTDGVSLPPTALVGNLRNLIAARVAHHLDLSGPALAVDTACSSSLVALHLARRSLEVGECDVAVVGGVSLNLTPTAYRLLESAQALSLTGRSRAFAAGADGFVPGEGAAAIVLEPLDRATDHGDRVLALVRGSAVNNDGRSLSLMAPNPVLQAAVIDDAYREAGIDPASVGYVEAHGTGTAVGDPIEARSLVHAFPPGPEGTPRWVGSVKTNIGHLLNAAGMPSLVKVILALQHRELPASLHHDRPSGELDLAAGGLQVITEHRDWAGPRPLRAGINGFGFGGTNAHVILQEAPLPAPAPAEPAAETPHLLTLSAGSDEALRAAASDMLAHTRAHPEIDDGDLCRSASTARDDAPHRLALVAGGDLAAALDARLEAWKAGEAPARAAGRRPRVALVFAGQGTQLLGLGCGLHTSQPAYRRMMEQLSDATGPVEGRTLVQWSLDPGVEQQEQPLSTAVTQPLLVAVGISLAAQLRAWGVQPDAVLGHSVGELTAAAVCGALTPAESVRLAARRGALMQERCTAGGMAAVLGPEADTREVVEAAEGRLSVAAVNGPEHLVISGESDALERVVAELTRRGARCRRLAVSRAFHSAMVDPALAGLREVAAELAPRPPDVPLLSSVTGAWSPALDPAYLVEHARRPVRFGPAVQRLLSDGYDTFVEIGPGSTLTALVRSIARSIKADEAEDVLALACLGDGARGDVSLLRTLGRLWERRVPLARPDDDGTRPRVDMPTYPFQRRRHWLPETTGAACRTGQESVSLSPLLNRVTWRETPLPAGQVLRSVCLVGGADSHGDGDVLQGLLTQLSRRGVPAHRATPDGLGERPDASVLVLVADLDQDTSVADALEVARHLAQRPTPLLVVTHDVLVTAVGPERPRPGQAVVAGLLSALPQEQPGQAVRVVDLCSLEDTGGRVECLLRELDAPPAAGPAESVAWRSGCRLGRTVEAGSAPERSREGLPADGSYLLTGGTGGVGRALARALAARGRPELILVGRSAAPPPGLLEELAGLGARPRYVAADVSLEADVEALAAGMPQLSGVFHAAGLVSPGRLCTQTAGEVEAVLAPKVRGTLLLVRALESRGRRPDVFVTFSSIAAVLPALSGGLASYAAANAHLDALAQAETHAGRPMQALDFAAWAGTGMADSLGFAALARRAGVPQLTAEAAVQAVLDAARVDEPQLVVLEPADLTSVLDGIVDRPKPTAPSSAVVGSQSRPDRPTTAGRSELGVRNLLTAMIAGELGLAPRDIDPETSFLAMGLDSLTAVDLVKRLEGELGRDLPTTLLFEHPSISRLTTYLEGGPATEPRAAGPWHQGVDEAQRESGGFALTPVQLAFHTLGRLHPDMPAYACLRLSLAGDVDADLMGRALALLEWRHPMLRVRIRRIDGQPRQEVLPAAESPSFWPSWFQVVEEVEPVQVVEDELCNRVFALADEPPVRAVLVRRDAEHSSLLLVLHHAAGDGASLSVLSRELWSVYGDVHRGADPALPSLTMTFRDQVEATETQRRSAAFGADRQFWTGRLARIPTVGSWLPEASGTEGFDRAGDVLTGAPLATRPFALTEQFTSELTDWAAQLGVSLFHLVLTAYLRRLACWTDAAEVTVDVARAGRDARLPDLGGVVGPFADTLPLSVSVAPGTPVADLTRRVRDGWLECERHGSLTSLDLARLLPAGGGPRTAGVASFSFARFPVGDLDAGPVRVVATAARTASAATRLGLLCWEFDGVLHFSWNYPARLFTPAVIERFTAELQAELEAVARPEAPPPPLVQRILEQCRRTPEAAAVATAGSELSYRDLDLASARVASRLSRPGMSRHERVVLLTTPGADTVVGLLGILRSGAAWVPLDATHPPARLADQVAQAVATAVVCSRATRATAALLGDLEVLDLEVDLDQDGDQTPGGSADDEPAPRVGPDDLAYVIFTSGTTGRPKGVPVTHRALTTYLDWAVSTFGYAPSDRMAATAPICFDASVRQLLAPLLVGACIVSVERDVLRDPQALLALVQEQRVSVWSSVPTLWAHLLQAAERRGPGAKAGLSALRWVHVGGEALSPAMVRRWFDLVGPGVPVANLYGPTEATINATYDVIESRPSDDVERMPIGVPVAQTVVDVVGPDGASCGDQVGELWLAGPGVSAGYLGESALSAEVFVEREGMRWYRTGDRVQRRADGRLDFLGRLDDQVTIRGHRVEPGEVEAALRQHPAVEAVAVTAETDTSGAASSVLTAWVQLLAARGEAASEGVEELPATGEMTPVGVEELRAYLAQRLPDYLCPARIHLVDTLPQTPSGKIDRTGLRTAALDIPGRAATGRPGTPPATDTELLVASVWGPLLGVDPVVREDEFFALGGDSIGVLEVFTRLEPDRPVLPAPTVLYRHRTLAALAQALDRHTAGEAGVPTRATSQVGAPFALSAAQRGFLLAEALDPGASGGWLAGFRLTGPLDQGLFQDAVDALVRRHLMLRVVVAADQRPPTQQEVSGEARLPVGYAVIAAEELPGRLAAESARGLDISGWPLVRLQLLSLSADAHVLVVHAHHIIGDGYSVVVLAQDLMALYDQHVDGQPVGLPPLRSTFADYVALTEGGNAGAASHPSAGRSPQEDRPSSASTDPYAAPDLVRGSDRGIGKNDNDNGDTGLAAVLTERLLLSESVTRALHRLSEREGTTRYAPFLTAYHRALARLTGQDDLVIGVAVTGRDHPLPDIGRLVGPLATLLPVRLRPTGSRVAAHVRTRDVAARVAEARAEGASLARLTRQDLLDGAGPAAGTQLVFSYLDFDALGGLGGRTLQVRWDEAVTDLQPPRGGTDLVLTVRPDKQGTRLTLRTPVGILGAEALRAFAADLRHELERLAKVERLARVERLAEVEPTRRDSPREASAFVLDAALIGYLPDPAHVARLAGISAVDGLRETIRGWLFPGRHPRLLEVVSTRLGRSGFVCLPLFADELTARGGDALARDAVAAVELAGAHGATGVSLAGMIPAHTAYGYDITRALRPEITRALRPEHAQVTTGHATTAASMVRTTLAALAASGRDLGAAQLACVGLGSIGRTSLELLLAVAGAPRRLVLCDVPARSRQLTELAASLRERAGMEGEIEVCTSTSGLPAQVYACDLVLAAVSGGGARLLDVGMLRPGTVVVDDSFPPCLDIEAAHRRMAESADVLVVGGGLLDCGPVQQRAAIDLDGLGDLDRALGLRLPRAIASCQLESLLRAAHPDLPAVRGLVDLPLALAYHEALEAEGVEAAALHLGTRAVPSQGARPAGRARRVVAEG